jgi:aminomethyltransferase
LARCSPRASRAASASDAVNTPDALLKLPLHEMHLAHGAKMAPFAGYEMPLQYAPGILKEHLHTRAAAGLFDVSHMGQVLLRPREGDMAALALALERLMPIDVVGLAPGRQRYGFLTTPSGGIRDDLMIANLGTCFLVVVNAACKVGDVAYLREHLAAQCELEVLENRVLIALQGPAAGQILENFAPAVGAMQFMDAGVHRLAGVACYVMRSGYTGEDGFEISISAEEAPSIVERLLADPEVQLVGLGARDSLRLEAGLCLHGSDIGLDTTPVEAALEWAIQAVRRPGGAREGGYVGADVIGRELMDGASRRRVGIRPDSRPVRAGAMLYTDETSTTPVGAITSGGFGPSVNGPVAMAYVPVALDAVGTRLYADVRGQRHGVTVARMPFFNHRYKK